MQGGFENVGSQAKHVNELRPKSESPARREIRELFTIKLKQRAPYAWQGVSNTLEVTLSKTKTQCLRSGQMFENVLISGNGLIRIQYEHHKRIKTQVLKFRCLSGFKRKDQLVFGVSCVMKLSMKAQCVCFLVSLQTPDRKSRNLENLN